MTPDKIVTELPQIVLLAGWNIIKDFWPFFLILFALVAVAMLIKANERSTWFRSKKDIQDLRRLTPKEFEEYIAELFKAMGYSAVVTGKSHDGGIDVEAIKNGVKHYIQCKKYITRQVPVGAVRDFYGAISDKIDGGKGYFITTQTFTLEAEKFAEGKPIELVDQFKLAHYIGLVKTKIPTLDDKACPKCGGDLKERNGKYGKFFGCSNYPKCSYTEKAK